MIINLTGLAWHLVWYVQCLSHVTEWIGCDREIHERHNKDCFEESFQLVQVKLRRDGNRAG